MTSREGQGILKSTANPFLPWKFLGKETGVLAVKKDTFFGGSAMQEQHIFALLAVKPN